MYLECGFILRPGEGDAWCRQRGGGFRICTRVCLSELEIVEDALARWSRVLSGGEGASHIVEF